jgi:zinc/manganese transport system substrate-binding protein
MEKTTQKFIVIASAQRAQSNPDTGSLRRLWRLAITVSFLVIFSLPLLLSQASNGAEPPLQVVTSFSILGNMVKEIGGDAVNVTVLAGPDADMHAFQPRPDDAKALTHAAIIVINGLGFEGWLHRLIEASGTHAKLLVASAGVKPRILKEGNKPVADPHAWQNLAFGRIYARNIAGALAAALPGHAAEISKRAERYDAQLKDMDATVREQFTDIPEAKRKIITSHDAFGYFGEAYGVTFLSPIGMNSETSASASDVARLIDQIKAEGVKVVFIENMSDPRLMKRIAHESGARLGDALYADALSPPDGPVSTYLDMFRANAPKLREAMQETRTP